MDYEKLHKDTITKLQQMVNSGKITVEVARDICADFVLESEDERIRKALINGFKDYKGWDEEWFDGITVRDAIAWFEKQGEQKSAWSEEDKRIWDIVWDMIDGKFAVSDSAEKEAKDWFISLKDRFVSQSKQEWSEEDEANLYLILQVLWNKTKIGTETCKKLEDWLKSLRSQNRWKPTEVQMKLLKEACDEHWEPDGLDPLYTLYKDLKKLREE